MARRKTRSKVVFDDHQGFSIEETNGVLKFFRLSEEEFGDWIYGQTCPVLADGKIGYFWYDLNRFVKWKLGGPTPIFD